MPIYNFSPYPSFGIGEHSFATMRAFSEEEVDAIIQYGDSMPSHKARIGGVDIGDEYSEIRVSNTAWIDLNQDTQWIYDRISWAIQQLNGQFYRFDLTGFSEQLQYTTYHGSNQGHYTWHKDSGADITGQSSNRKLSAVLQLSDPNSYTGGELQILDKSDPSVVLKEKGLLAAFPAYSLHRVTPVTSGTRKTLVSWVDGPPFR